MNRILLIGLLCVAVTHVSCSQKQEACRERLSFNEGWIFHLGDIPEASESDFDDSGWRKLDLPHDWAIEGDFSQDNPSGTGGGALPGGIGWYRKSFIADMKDIGKEFYIDFDGVYMNSEVYVNGVSLGIRPYGYVSFRYDLTPHLLWGKENVVAVRVDNEEQPNSRWYSGCGIYRNVWLTKVNPVHVAQWGTYVTTDEVTSESAKVHVRTRIENHTESVGEITLLSQVVDAQGKVMGEVSLDAGKDDSQELQQTVAIANPTLWTIENPYIYNVKSILKDKATGDVLDTYDTPFGIRTFSFDAEKGFVLNGKSTKINGVCMHHDLGCLGAAVNVRAIQRQLEILKEMGCNGIRCSHNPPSPELLQLCDEMGFIVMDETFDMWRKKKTKHDLPVTSMSGMSAI